MIPKLKLLSPRSEAVIQKEILTFLSLHGLFVFRVNTTGVFDPRRKVFRKLGGFSMKGVADILGILPNGQFLAIEVKTASGKQSPFQKNFRLMCRRCTLTPFFLMQYIFLPVRKAFRGEICVFSRTKCCRTLARAFPAKSAIRGNLVQ